MRHAHAGDPDRWPGPDDLRPLSRRGERQARNLVERLGGARVDRIISSHSLRCTQTVAPLSRERGLAIEIDDRLYVGASPDVALRWFGALGDRPTAVSSHGDVVGGVVLRLAASGAVSDTRLRWGKGSLWVLEGDGTAITRARYVPASDLPPGASPSDV